MKKIVLFLSLSALLTSCKTLIPLHKLPSKVLQEVLKEENLPKVQFYTDRQIELHLDSAGMDVDFDKKGAILQKNSRFSENVVIPKKTKGVYAARSTETIKQPVHSDLPSRSSIPVSFDDEGTSVIFSSGKGKPSFVLATNGKFVFCTIDSVQMRYVLLEGSGAELLVSKKILNSLTKKKKVASGKKVEN